MFVSWKMWRALFSFDLRSDTDPFALLPHLRFGDIY